ncbi:MAG: hypothetical protein ASARMPRED_001322 [Alectoria sarmentosa]|nr:MAG: hypothetical protein ASARMPRED_001322 [Alectoria sarmentosa]
MSSSTLTVLTEDSITDLKEHSSEDNKIITIPRELNSKATLRFLGLSKAATDDTWSRYAKFIEQYRYEDVIGFAKATVRGGQDTASIDNDDWIIAMRTMGVRKVLRNRIMTPGFESIRLTKTPQVWVLQTFKERWFELKDLDHIVLGRRGQKATGFVSLKERKANKVKEKEGKGSSSKIKDDEVEDSRLAIETVVQERSAKGDEVEWFKGAGYARLKSAFIVPEDDYGPGEPRYDTGCLESTPPTDFSRGSGDTYWAKTRQLAELSTPGKLNGKETNKSIMANDGTDGMSSGRSASMIARNFSADLNDAFSMDRNLDGLVQSVQLKKEAVNSQNQELQALEARLRDTEQRLKEQQSRDPSPAGKNDEWSAGVLYYKSSGNAGPTVPINVGQHHVTLEANTKYYFRNRWRHTIKRPPSASIAASFRHHHSIIPYILNIGKATAMPFHRQPHSTFSLSDTNSCSSTPSRSSSTERASYPPAIPRRTHRHHSASAPPSLATRTHSDGFTSNPSSPSSTTLVPSDDEKAASSPSSLATKMAAAATSTKTNKKAKPARKHCELEGERGCLNFDWSYRNVYSSASSHGRKAVGGGSVGACVLM